MAMEVVSKETFLGKWLPSLPQAHMISTADAIRWYDSAIAIDPDRIAWHFTRLRGFGGSDIGDLVAWRLNLPGFAEPEAIVNEKLMRVPLAPGNKYMKRGVRAEPLIREHFREEYEAAPLPDVIEDIRRARVPAHPWMRGNPDDAAVIGPWSCLIDYKAKSYPSNTAPIHYSAQVHQYDLLAYFAKHGEMPSLDRSTPHCFDKYLIVYYDYPGACSYPILVDYDPEVARAVIEAGDFAWQVVMGERPLEFPRTSQIDYTSKQQLEPEEAKALRKLSDEWVTLKLLANNAYSNLKRTEEEIARLLSRGGTRLPSKLDAQFRAAHGYFKATVDEEIVSLMAARANVEIDTLKKSTTELDAKAMAERLAELGEEPIYVKTLDAEKVATFCQERNLRLPIEEKPVLQLSRAHRHADFIEEGKERAASAVSLARNAMREFVGESPITPNAPLDFEGSDRAETRIVQSLESVRASAKNERAESDLPELPVTPKVIRPRH